MDPVHAGIMIVLALNISLMTPPVGACLFVLASVTGERIERIAKSLWPFLLAEVGVLFVVAYWPDLTLFVPRLLGLTHEFLHWPGRGSAFPTPRLQPVR